MRRLLFSDARPSQRRCSRAGFTLVELIVTLSIAAILLTIGVPSMIDLVRDARLASQSDQFASTLNLARTEAIKRRSNIKVCPSTTPNSATTFTCTADESAWATGWMVGEGSNILQRNAATAGLSVDSDSATSVDFSGTFGSAGAASSFQLCMPGRKEHLVRVAASGHVSKSIGSTTCP